MQRTLRIVLAILLVATLATLLVPAALSRGRGHYGMGGPRMAPVDEMYNVVNLTGATDTSVSFDILGSAIKDKNNTVVAMTPSKPRTGTYYFANDTAVLPFGNVSKKDHRSPVKTDYDNATLDVTGASAVVAWKNITRTGTGKGDFGIQFTDLSVYLPGGHGKSYKFSTPVRIAKSADNSSMLIVGTNQTRAALQDMLAGGARFPAGTPPVKLSAVDAVK